MLGVHEAMLCGISLTTSNNIGGAVLKGVLDAVVPWVEQPFLIGEFPTSSHVPELKDQLRSYGNPRATISKVLMFVLGKTTTQFGSLMS